MSRRRAPRYTDYLSPSRRSLVGVNLRTEKKPGDILIGCCVPGGHADLRHEAEMESNVTSFRRRVNG